MWSVQSVVTSIENWRKIDSKEQGSLYHPAEPHAPCWFIRKFLSSPSSSRMGDARGCFLRFEEGTTRKYIFWKQKKWFFFPADAEEKIFDFVYVLFLNLDAGVVVVDLQRAP